MLSLNGGTRRANNWWYRRANNWWYVTHNYTAGNMPVLACLSMVVVPLAGLYHVGVEAHFNDTAAMM